MVWETVLIFVSLMFLVLITLAIPILLRLKDTLRKANTTMDILNKDLPDVLSNLNEITGTLNNTTKKIETTIDDVVEIERMVSKEIKQPLQNIASSIATLLQLANKIFDRRSKK